MTHSIKFEKEKEMFATCIFPWKPNLNAAVVALKMLLWKQLAIHENRLKILISREIPFWMRNAVIIRVAWIPYKFAMFSVNTIACESVECELKRKRNVHQRMPIEWQLWHWICTECIKCHCTICAMCIIIHFTPEQRR